MRDDFMSLCHHLMVQVPNIASIITSEQDDQTTYEENFNECKREDDPSNIQFEYLESNDDTEMLQHSVEQLDDDDDDLQSQTYVEDVASCEEDNEENYEQSTTNKEHVRSHAMDTEFDHSQIVPAKRIKMTPTQLTKSHSDNEEETASNSNLQKAIDAVKKGGKFTNF
jgi:hypothetical protein